MATFWRPHRQFSAPPLPPPRVKYFPLFTVLSLKDGPASRFLLAHPQDQFFITPTIAGEMACGLSLASRSDWEAFLHPFEVLPMVAEVSWHYGEIYRHLRHAGNPIGSNDLWIAAAARAHHQALVTGNIDEFKRVPGLQVVKF